VQNENCDQETLSRSKDWENCIAVPDVRERKRWFRDLQVAQQKYRKGGTTIQKCTGRQVYKQRKLRGEEGKLRS